MRNSKRLLDVELLDCGGWTGRISPRPCTPWAPLASICWTLTWWTTSSSFAPSLILSLSLQLPHIPGMLLSSCLSLRVVMLSSTHSTPLLWQDNIDCLVEHSSLCFAIQDTIFSIFTNFTRFSFSYLSLSQIISFKTSHFVGRRPLGSEEQGFQMRKYSGYGRLFFATSNFSEAGTSMNNDKSQFNGFLNISEIINISSRGKEQSLNSKSFTFGYNRGFSWLRIWSLFDKILLMESLIFGGNLENL